MKKSKKPVLDVPLSNMTIPMPDAKKPKRNDLSSRLQATSNEAAAQLRTLESRLAFYNCLESCGVDNWEGYEIAMDLFAKRKRMNNVGHQAIQSWKLNHPRVRDLEVDRILQSTDVTKEEIQSSLEELCEDGSLEMMYKIRASSSSTLLETSYESLDEIPEWIFDDGSNRFHRDDVDIISVYRVLEG